MPDFLARGGDGLGAVLDPLPAGRIDLGLAREHNLRDSLIAFWQGRGKALTVPTPGRTTLVGDEKCPAAKP